MAEQNPQVRDLTAQEVAQGLQDGRFMLVDVREPNETAVDTSRSRSVIQFRPDRYSRSCWP